MNKEIDRKHISRVLSRLGYAMGWNNETKTDTIYYKDEWKNHERNWGGITNPVSVGYMTDKAIKRIKELGFQIDIEMDMWVLK